MEFKDSVLSTLNESFLLGRDGVLRYKNMLYSSNVNDLRSNFLAEAHGARVLFIQVPPTCIMTL